VIPMGTETKLAYVKLAALRQHLPNKGRVGHRLVLEVNEAINILARLDYDVSPFLIRDSDLSRVLHSIGQHGEQNYSSELSADAILVGSRLDALMMLFDTKGSDKKVGSAPPD
jgi:hypothetical protein